MGGARKHSELGFLSGGGEMGALMRAHDWSHSSLGPPSRWPQPLRTIVRIMLNTGHPMYVWWGADSACLYNDAYRESIGPERHPGSLGRPARVEEVARPIVWLLSDAASFITGTCLDISGGGFNVGRA